MSGTIYLATGCTHTNGALSVPIASKTKTIVQTGQGVFTDTQILPITTAVPVTIGSISTLGVVWIENLDTVNFIDIGILVSATFYAVIRVLAGERYPFRVKPGITLYGVADTATVKTQKTIYEN